MSRGLKRLVVVLILLLVITGCSGIAEEGLLHVFFVDVGQADATIKRDKRESIISWKTSYRFLDPRSAEHREHPRFLLYGRQ